MQLAHVALWTRDIDAAAEFWSEFFDGAVGERYASRNRAGFVSRFVTLPVSGLKIELMEEPWVADAIPEAVGWADVALSAGSREAVDAAADRFAGVGLLVSSPRVTGDGYYEAVVRMPDGTQIEIVA